MNRGGPNEHHCPSARLAADLHSGTVSEPGLSPGGGSGAGNPEAGKNAGESTGKGSVTRTAVRRIIEAPPLARGLFFPDALVGTPTGTSGLIMINLNTRGR